MKKIKTDNTNKIDKQSPDLRQEMLDKLKKLYPPLFDNEGMLNQDELEQLVSDFSTPQTEKYEFNWAGKQQSKKKAFTASRATLRSDEKRSVDFDKTENLIIEGDNLEVLKLLQKSYFGKIKCIYIDPPYNTGNDFIYSDDYSEDKLAYWEKSGVKQNGVKLDTNTDSSGRYHSNWLSMMYPRLLLARNLLKEDGVIFVSIDDNEVHNLRKLMDEVFGEENFINLISVKSKPSAGASGGGEDRRLKKNIEYLLTYSKSDEFTQFNDVYKETELMDYIEDMKRKGTSFKYTSVLYKCENKTSYKTIKDGAGEPIEIFKVNDYEIKSVKDVSRIEKISVAQVYEKYFDKIITTTNAQTSIRDRVWKATDSENNLYSAVYVPVSGKNKGKKTELLFMGKQKVLIIWLKDTASKMNGKLYKRQKVGTFWDGFSWINVSKEGSIKFSNGKKPIDLIKRTLYLSTSKDSDDIVLDFFAGSGSTGHAVVDANNNDNGNRKYILVQLPEEIGKKDDLYKEGFRTISEVCIERLKRVRNKLKESSKQQKLIDEGNKIDAGFKVFKLATSHFPENTFAPDPDKSDEENKKALETYIKKATSQKGLFRDGVVDLIYEIALKDGFELTLKMDKVKGFDKNTVYRVSDSTRVAFICVDDSLEDATIKQLEDHKDQRFICLHNSVNTTKKWNLQNILGSNLWLV